MTYCHEDRGARGEGEREKEGEGGRRRGKEERGGGDGGGRREERQTDGPSLHVGSAALQRLTCPCTVSNGARADHHDLLMCLASVGGKCSKVKDGHAGIFK